MSTDKNQTDKEGLELLKSDLTQEIPKGQAALMIIIVCLVFIGVFYYKSGNVDKTPEQIKTEKIEKLFRPYDGSHYGLTQMIKDAMHDPSSYEHIRTRHECDTHTCDSLLVRTSYRGKNAFGAIVKGRVVARVDLEGNITDVISQE